MKKIECDSGTKKNIWISITGYRTLLVYKSLLEKGRSVKELIEILSNNKNTNKAVSEDTVRVTLNTLKSAGCIISRPKKSNGFKYELIKHPFSLSLNKEKFHQFLALRNRFASESTYDKVFTLNSLYDKFFNLTQNDEYMNDLENSKPLLGVNKDIVKEFAGPKLKNKKVNIHYDSPTYGEEDIDIIPQRLTYENTKLYLCCFIYKYGQFSILNLDRIMKINNVSLSKFSKEEIYFEVKYKLIGDSLTSFIPEMYEEIVEKNDDYIIVNAKVANEFCFIQRLLLFGRDFRIISPDFFKEKLINKIKQIRKGYSL